jgi:flagella basal body P-ring formation protein FlgA
MKTIGYMISALCAMFLVLATEARAANPTNMDKIEIAVREDLAKTVSDKAVFEELKVVKGAELLGQGAPDLTVKKLEQDGYAGRNKILYSVYLRDPKKRTVNVVVEASYDMLAEVFVTARPLVKGDVISRGDYYPVRQKLSKLPTGAVFDRKDIEGKTVRSNIMDGVVLRTLYLQTATTARRGKKVNLVIEGNAVVVSAKGTLRNDARVGESASVLCDLTRKEVHGVLITPTLVKVKI